MKVYEDIERLTPAPNYRVNMSWGFLTEHLTRWKAIYSLDINPDFQRGHVWTKEQKTAYIEYCLRGGAYSRDIMFNCFRFTSGEAHPMVLVDGLQRLTAITEFLLGEVKVFGGLEIEDFEDKETILLREDIVINVNSLPGKKAVYQWYLELNAGGTPHTPLELDSVRELLDKAPMVYVYYHFKSKRFIGTNYVFGWPNYSVKKVETYSDRTEVYLG